MIEPFQLTLSDRVLAGAAHLPQKRQNAPWVVLCHGLFSSMASEKFTVLAEMLSQCGIAALRFDFSGCGESTGDIADTTVSRRLQELGAVVEYASSRSDLGQNWALMGSSLGGFVALLFAARNPCKALSVWATPYELTAIRDNIPAQDLGRLKPVFFEDAASYRLKDMRLVPPVQIIHGTCDEIVPVAQAKQLCSIESPVCKCIIIPSADHRISNPEHRKEALDACCLWLKQHFENN